MSSSSRVDSSAGLLVREGPWSNENVDGAFEGSVATTSSGGARLSLDFTGTSVAVFGMIPAAMQQQQQQQEQEASPISLYSIDGVLVATQLIVSQDEVQNDVLFFRSPLLASGSHRLTVEYGANSGATQPLSIDYFEVYSESGKGDPTSSSATPTSRSSPSSSPRPSGTSTEVSIAHTSSASSSDTSSNASARVSSAASATLPNSSGADASHPSFSLYAKPSSTGELSPTTVVATNGRGNASGPPLGPIIGGAVGGLALIALAILLAIYLRKRRREKHEAMLSVHSLLASGMTETGHGRQGPTSFSIGTTPSSSFAHLPAKTEHADTFTDSMAPEPSHVSPTPATSSVAAGAWSNNRHTMHSIQTSRTAGTVLPEYNPQGSALASITGQAGLSPPPYQT